MTRLGTSAVAAVLGLVLAGGCGREDVELAASAAADAGSSDAEPTASDGGRPVPPASACDAGVARTCRALDLACQLDAECCSGRCDGDRCLPAGTCSAAGAACATPASCCSGRCEPVGGTTNRACAPLCKAAGAACASAQECCSLGCIAGVCASALCIRTGDDCTRPSDCCSGVCDGKCRLDPVALCRPSGEDCTSGGGPACCFACVDGRCDPGPGACRPRAAPCGKDADCCSGTCLDAGGGVRACGGACGGDGAACTAASDCCSGACSASPGTCVSTAQPACAVLGAACTVGEACCSGVCQDGRCADNCGTLR